MRKKEIVTFTNMCMVRSGNTVLVQNRRDKKWPGISFPGGHVEEGESFTDSVIREVKEETGLLISAPKLCGVKDWYDENGRYVVFLYQTDSFSGDIVSSEEGEVYWVDMNSLSTLDLAEDMEELFKVFFEEDISEFFYNRSDGKWTVELK